MGEIVEVRVVIRIMRKVDECPVEETDVKAYVDIQVEAKPNKLMKSSHRSRSRKKVPQIRL